MRLPGEGRLGQALEHEPGGGHLLIELGQQ
jgi:hypothetical protein